MKRFISVLLCMAMLLICTGCGEIAGIVDEFVTDNSGQTPGDEKSPEPTPSASEEPAEQYESVSYNVKEPESSIKIPKDYKLLTRNTSDFSIEMQELGMTKSDLVAYLDSYGSEFVAISPDNNMQVMLKAQKPAAGMDNLLFQEKDVIEGFAEGLQKGFGAKSYELDLKHSMLWVKLEYTHSVNGQSAPSDYIRYATIADGWNITLWASAPSGKITDQNRKELQFMLDNFALKKIIYPPTMP